MIENRLKVADMTARGMKAPEMSKVADLMHRVLSGSDDEYVDQRIRSEVRELCAQFPLPH